jgi:hypothetical protein
MRANSKCLAGPAGVGRERTLDGDALAFRAKELLVADSLVLMVLLESILECVLGGRRFDGIAPACAFGSSYLDDVEGRGVFSDETVLR